jgi:adenosylmethionine-8-amino-7-oxononanoate aminotransferase
VENRESNNPFSADVMAIVKKTLLDSGLFTFITVKDMGTMILIVPTLCITKGQINEGLALIEAALEVTDRKVKIA